MEVSTVTEKLAEEKLIVNGECANAVVPSPPAPVTSPSGGFRHHMPQIAGVMRSTKLAQSKAVAKHDSLEKNDNAEATLHVEGTGKVVKMDADLKTELCVQEAGDVSPGTCEVAQTDEDKEKDDPPATTKGRAPKGRSKGRKSAGNGDTTPTASNKTRVNTPKEEKSAAVETKQTYKNIFQEPLVEGKRSRKPKVIEFEESATTPSKKSPVKTPEPKKKPSVSESALEETKPAQWLVGDLLWGKVPGHPWWPCMVAYDPYQSIYTQMKVRSRSYHVQFFGDEGERGWVYGSSIMEFKGKNEYQEHVKQVYANAKRGEKQKLDKLYKEYPGRMNAWEIAIKEATEALPMSRNDRKQKYTYVYDQSNMVKKNDTAVSDSNSKSQDSPKEKTTRRRKRKRATQETENDDNDNDTESVEEKSKDKTKTPRAKRRKVSDNTPSNGPSPTKVSGSADGCFDVFCQKHRDSVLEEHPDFDEDMLLGTLKQQWCMMSQKQKARYKSKFGVESGHGSPELPLKKRISKPSFKKQMMDVAADEDEEMKSEEEPEKKQKLSSKPATDDEVSNVSSLDDVINGVASGSISVSVSERVNEKKELISETVIPAKLGRPRKSTSSVQESENSDSQEESTTVIKKQPKESEDVIELSIFKLSSSGPRVKENLCQICFKTGELLECEGPCQDYFHLDCLGLKAAPSGAFKCDECLTGNHTCFACKKADKETKKCSKNHCGKFYHEHCVNNLLNTKTDTRGGMVCPLHTCETCAALDTPRAAQHGSKDKKLLRCLQCPTAYHVGEFCMAAGTEVYPGYSISCSKHFQPIKSQKHHSHINVSWCFVCNRGGSLLCCESCPAAFHSECLKINPPEGHWYCQDCTSGKRPLYGDIIWVKLGSYRWWPGEICHPDHVPQNIQDKTHQVGEFPVRFFGSNDYFWIHMGRVFSFQEGDKGSKDSSSVKHLAKVFHKGVKEATEAYKRWKQAKENKEHIENMKNEKKPAPYKYVKNNVPVGSVQIYKADMAEIPRCECKEEQVNPCSSETDCLNRMLMYECHPSVCPAGDKCQNQRFQKRDYPDSMPFKTDERGWGLKTNVDIKKGQFVNEYVGELIDEQEVKRRIVHAHDNSIGNFYMLTLDKNRIIDAGPKGNLSRFMNHCCNPNCETQKWTVNGDVRVGLFALHDIPAGSELTFNYNLECLGNDKTACACGAPNCSGFLGVRPKTAAAVANEKRAKEAKEAKKKKKRRIKLDVKKEHEDECFRCGEGGELVMCDKASCTKVYHLQCLKLIKPPHGSWYCPWHHCDMCGKVAVKMCQECPNSFCQVHAEGNVKEIEGMLYCADHDDVQEGTSSSCASSVASSDNNSDMAEVHDEIMNVDKNETPKGKADVPTVEAKIVSVKTHDRKVPHKAITNLDRKRSLNKKDIHRKRQNESSSKRPKKAESAGNQTQGSKGPDPLAVAPMFDDSEDEFSNLVIDIPTIL